MASISLRKLEKLAVGCRIPAEYDELAVGWKKQKKRELGPGIG